MTEAWLWPWSGVYAASVVVMLAIIVLVSRRRSLGARRLALVLVVITTGTYLTWRVTETIPIGMLGSTTAGIVLVTAEIIGAIQIIATVAMAWRRPAESQPGVHTLDQAATLPSVDIFITTYDESIAVLEPTLAAAMGIRYPGDLTVYLCDDGSREAVRTLAERYGAVHLTRTEHAHAKAGNLNNALAHSRGDLVVTLDADMIPRASFLEVTVGHFDDPRMAYVQAPQAFHNEDPFQYNLFSGSALPNEQDYFMRSMQEGKAAYNAVMYVGSNTVFRRSALEHIGGFATGVITEDMATGMLLQSAGYRSAFVPQIIAAGLAPETFATLLTQRTRWSRGNIQTARKWNPLTIPGLSFMQRWLYLDGIIYWHFGVLKLVFVVAPLLYLLGGILVVDADLSSVLLMWLPYFATSLVAMRVISQGRRSSLWTHVYETAMAPTVALAVLAEWVGLSNRAFAVTPKGVSTDSLNFRIGIALPNLLLLTLSIVALLNAWWWSQANYTVDSLLVTTFWTLYNIVGLAMAVLVCLERPRRRRTERTAVSIRATASFWHGGDQFAWVLDLSAGGARLLIPWAANGGPQFSLSAPQGSPVLTIADVGSVPGAVRWVKEEVDGLAVGFEFVAPTAPHLIGVMRHITESPDWVRTDREDDARVAGAAARTVVGAARRARPGLRAESRLLTRGLAQLRIDAEPVTVHLEDVSFGGCRIRTDRQLRVGQIASVDLSDSRDMPRLATVQWVERRRRRYIAGMRFDSSRLEETLHR